VLKVVKSVETSESLFYEVLAERRFRRAGPQGGKRVGEVVLRVEVNYAFCSSEG